MNTLAQRSRWVVAVIGFFLLGTAWAWAFVPTDAYADTIYSYIDDQGTPVWTDNFNSIPERYRAKVKTTERSTPPTVQTSSVGSIHRLVTDWSKRVTGTVGSLAPEISGLTPDQSRIATFAGLIALVCLMAMYLSRSQVVKFLALWVLILLGVGTPVLLYTSQGGPGDVMKAKATDAAKKQQDRLQQVP